MLDGYDNESLQKESKGFTLHRPEKEEPDESNEFMISDSVHDVTEHRAEMLVDQSTESIEIQEEPEESKEVTEE